MARKRRYYGRISSETFGPTLRAWRQAADLNLEKAAKRLGIECKSPGAYLSQIERGQRTVPDKVLRNVSNVYKITPEEVFRQAYSPQLHFPILDAVMKPTALPKDIEDQLIELEKQLDDQDKRDLIHYAAFLILRRGQIKTH